MLTQPLCSTFFKRKGGLFKKAHELSVLCSVNVAVIILGDGKKLYEYSSSDIGEILQQHNSASNTPWHIIVELLLIRYSIKTRRSIKDRSISVAKDMWMKKKRTIIPWRRKPSPKSHRRCHRTSQIKLIPRRCVKICLCYLHFKSTRIFNTYRVNTHPDPRNLSQS